MSDGKSLFVIQRQAYMGSYGQAAALIPCDGEAGPSLVPIRAFTSKQAAEQECEKLEREAQHTIPFYRGFRDERCTPQRFQVVCQKVGLPVPKLETKAKHEFELAEKNAPIIAAWWAENLGENRAEMNARLWAEFFPTWRFYTVVESQLV
jgi:hypothetical protein